MIYVREGVWETNSSSMHVFMISTDPNTKIKLPNQLIVRLIKQTDWDPNTIDPQTRLDNIVRFIVSSSSTAQAIYRLHKFINQLHQESGIEFTWDFDSFDNNAFDYAYDECMVDDLFERSDPIGILFHYFTNSKSCIDSFGDDSSISVNEKIDRILSDPSIKLIYRQHD